MNISLTKELELYLQKKVRSGLYTSVSEVVREGLRLLQEQDRLKAKRFAEHRGETGAGSPAPARSETESKPAPRPTPATRLRPTLKPKGK